MKRRTIGIIAIGAALLVAGCSDSAYDATHDDSQEYRTRDFAAWDVVIGLDGYRNIATACDNYQEGKRFYVPTKTDGSSFILLVDDANCHIDTARITDRR